ncbi:hypothetical protein PspLS_01543 [Pyricularia sp. CBS 133598]|nr:hypothetical protein PspLS_01543 [Pyricularia sp. CBS 133598]
MKYILVAAIGALPFVSALPATGYDLSAKASLDSRDINDGPLSEGGNSDLVAPFLHRGGLGPAIAPPTLSRRGNVPSKVDDNPIPKTGLVSSPQMTAAMGKVQMAAAEKAWKKKKDAPYVNEHDFYPGNLGWDIIVQDPAVQSVIKTRPGVIPKSIKVSRWWGRDGELKVVYDDSFCSFTQPGRTVDCAGLAVTTDLTRK